MRPILLAALVAGCAPAPLQLVLPELPAATRAVAIGVERGDERRAVAYDLDALGAAPTLDDWDGEDASYTVLALARTLDELGGVAGPLAGDGIALPAPITAFGASVAAPPRAWSETAEIPAWLDALRIPAQPLDCMQAVARPVRGLHEDVRIEQLVATELEGGFLTGVDESSEYALYQLDPAGAARQLPYPRELGDVDGLAYDGAVVFAAGSQDRVARFDRDGQHLGTSGPGVAGELTLGVDGRVYGYNPDHIVALARDSTTAVELHTRRTGYIGVERLAVLDPERMVAIDDGALYALEDGRWVEQRLDSALPPRDVAMDEGAAYAMTPQELFRRPHGASNWTRLSDREGFEKFGIQGTPMGVLAIYGYAGLLELRPRATLEDTWCPVTLGTHRELAKASVDPAGRGVLALVEKSGGDPAIVFQVHVP